MEMEIRSVEFCLRSGMGPPWAAMLSVDSSMAYIHVGPCPSTEGFPRRQHDITDNNASTPRDADACLATVHHIGRHCHDSLIIIIISSFIRRSAWSLFLAFLLSCFGSAERFTFPFFPLLSFGWGVLVSYLQGSLRLS
jgi:hypothetical protein